MKKIKRIAIFSVILLTIGSVQSFGSDELKEEKIAEPLSAGLDHLINQVYPGNTVDFDPKKIDKVLDYLTVPKQASVLYYPEVKFDSTPIYCEFDINISMKKLLQYSYNRDLPSYIFNPSSIRLSYWLNVATPGKRLPYFYDYLPKLDQPIVAYETEHTEITPDLNTGAYYKYNELRSLILLKYKGRNVFISISKQKDISSPSMKGIILDDTNWDYLYSGIKGHTKFGLGWAESFMYDSCSIVIYYEADPKKPVLRCGVFKWLRAGWNNVNMVKKEHIYGGMKRYERDMKIILENPLLPDFNNLKDNISRVGNLPLNIMREKTKTHLNLVKKKYAVNDLMSRKEFRDLFTSDKYINQLTQLEMGATLIMDYIKNILGKKSSI